MSLATIIDTKALWQTIWTAAASGVVGCVVFAVAVLGATRSSDAGREGRPSAAVSYGVLAALCTAAALGMAVYGIVLIAHR
jgi:hypothetical protein